MAGNVNTMKKKKVGKGKSILTGLLSRLSNRKSSKEDFWSQVHPIIPYQMSLASQLLRPYRPCMVLNLETIWEEEDDHSCMSPFHDTPIRTPLYFVKGSQAKRFRFRRHVKLMWKVHSTRFRCNLTHVLCLFRIRKDRQQPPASSSALGIM